LDAANTSLIATAEILSKGREAWRGTAFICAQPAEETGEGAEAMPDHGSFTNFALGDVAFSGIPVDIYGEYDETYQ
jgi:metal-dependent amidase/aminoacylase/carboxypeptidase family protein